MSRHIQTQCVIPGGGPAGIILGYLLARAGIDVYVLEKHSDFFRDFRGDTIHPSTMDVLQELGILDEFLKLPHNKTRQLIGHVSGSPFAIADFSHLKTCEKYVAFIPQWDFLNFLTKKARAFSTFHLLMETEANGIIRDAKQVVTGVTAKDAKGAITVSANLVVGADGRHSTIQQSAKMETQDLGAPIDIFWFRLPQDDQGAEESLAYVDSNHMMVLLDRDSYWQCGYLLKKGTGKHVRQMGLEQFKKSITDLVPLLSESVQALTNWDQIKLLSVRVDRLKKWHQPGLLMIGDAAHAMSPVGGVGINLAIQDAVATANVLIPSFIQNGKITEDDLVRIQDRRIGPTIKTQRMQVFLHQNLMEPILNNRGPTKPPLILKLLKRFPILQRIPARFVGIGFGPEHISPEVVKHLQNQP